MHGQKGVPSVKSEKEKKADVHVLISLHHESSGFQSVLLQCDVFVTVKGIFLCLHESRNAVWQLDVL